jgi:hypothetical protein
MRILILFFIAIGMLISQPGVAQNNKIEGPLGSFVNTPFMLKFKDLKIEAEAAVRRFKLQSHALDPQDVQKVQTGYEQSAYRFNQLLLGIKEDFMNKKKLKYIESFPDDYLRSLELELHQLSEFYAIHFTQPLADATAEQTDGSATLLLVVELVGLTKGLINYFSQVKQQSRQFNETYLQQHLIQPFKFRTWDEISAEGSVMPSPVEEVMQPDLMEAPTLDPLLEEASLLFQNNTNNDTYDNADTYDEWLDQNGEDTFEDDPMYNEEGNSPSDSTRFLLQKNENKQKVKTTKTKDQNF